MKLTLLAALTLCLAPGQPDAAEMRAQAGQPFCQRFEDLQPYLLALIQNSMEEAHRYDCGGLPKGAKLVVLDDIQSESSIGISHVRAYILGGDGSLVGYTLVIN